MVLNKNPTVDVRGVFLDTFKAFGKVWHDRLLIILKTWCRR